MKDQPNVYTLRYAVMDAVNEIGDETLLGKYERFFQLGVTALKDINTFHASTIKTVYLDVNDAHQVVLPDDYVDYVSIGVPMFGTIYPLSLNPNLQLSRSFECGSMDNNIDYQMQVNTYPFTYYGEFYKSGVYVGGVYGAGGGTTNVQFKIDQEYGLIQLTGSVPDNQIVLQYKSNGISADGMTIITSEQAQVIKRYIVWMYYLHDKKANAYDKETLERLYHNEVKKLRFLKDHIRYDELLDLFYQSWKQSPKR